MLPRSIGVDLPASKSTWRVSQWSGDKHPGLKRAAKQSSWSPFYAPPPPPAISFLMPQLICTSVMFSAKLLYLEAFHPTKTCIHNAVSRFYFHLETLYLFTRSDFKTIVAPVLLFSLGSSPSLSLSRLPHVVFWIWLHLLKTCTSNQYLAPHEDGLNKPWRPIPSGRISIHAAKMLSLALIPMCFAVSMLYDVLGFSVLFVLMSWFYNEGGLHSTWVAKQFLNALGYGSLELGATAIMAGVIPLDDVSYTAAAISTLIILSTCWAQDFADQDGDRLQGNITIPIIAPRASRIIFPIVVMAWGMAIVTIWEQEIRISIPFLVFTAIAGIRFWVFRAIKEDEMSYLIYNVWLTLLHLFPAVRRTHLETVTHADYMRLFQRSIS